METRIIAVKNARLTPYVQYFIFFKHQDVKPFQYTTFPNTNLCLTIYKQNTVKLRRDVAHNTCHVSGGEALYSSYLIGFHKTPFTVELKTPMEQVCILFHPGGLRAFTEAPYRELMQSNEVFNLLFERQAIPERLFEIDDPESKANFLETFLLTRLKITADSTRFSSHIVKRMFETSGMISVNSLSGFFSIDNSTLYRIFTAHIGQSPKDFMMTLRFRYALDKMVRKDYRNLSELTYQSNFFDQSHFIKDFRKSTGQLPHTLQKQLAVEQNTLVWLKS